MSNLIRGKECIFPVFPEGGRKIQKIINNSLRVSLDFQTSYFQHVACFEVLDAMKNVYF